MNESPVSNSAVVGADVAKKKVDICLLFKGKSKSKVFLNTPAGHREMQRWLADRGCVPLQTHVCMEATGPYSEGLATALADGGWQVSVVNPLRVKAFAQSELSRNKTDKADAAALARFCVAHKPDLWSPPSLAVRELRAWVDRRQALMDMLQQEENRTEALQAEGQREVIAHVQIHISWLKDQIARLERDIDDHIDRHPDLKQDAELITSIPGIGDITAAKVLAYAGNVRRFEDAKALAAYIGVTPRQRESGSSVRGRSAISRIGHKALRTALYMPSVVARRHNGALKAFSDRLAAKGLAKKAIIGAVMRKMAHLIYGVIKSGQPFDITRAMPKLDLQDGI